MTRPHLSTGSGWAGSPVNTALHLGASPTERARPRRASYRRLGPRPLRPRLPGGAARAVREAGHSGGHRTAHAPRYSRGSTCVRPGRGHRARGIAPVPTPAREPGCELGIAPRGRRASSRGGVFGVKIARKGRDTALQPFPAPQLAARAAGLSVTESARLENTSEIMEPSLRGPVPLSKLSGTFKSCLGESCFEGSTLPTSLLRNIL